MTKRTDKQKALDVLLPAIARTGRPGIPVTNLLADIVDQVNRNTIAIAPPRDVAERQEEEPSAFVTWRETSTSFEEVRVTNPEDETQYVDVKRRTQSTFENAATGEIFKFIFDNSLLD